ncbi:sigma 54-interacting transcriptional regulator [Ihubacter sp. rT4E-8]|uniref:sigma 54-interacting transcriptional regulator n=1 Tax=Ihubacter sp. rT4E-8 TaxID=3242369 RepID=UPI003CEED971
MKKSQVKSVVELLMDSMNLGVVYVDHQGKIQLCNRKAKEITGIIINAQQGHAAGRISEGDIVIIADNKLGEDDGLMGREELSYLNIHDTGIEKGDMLVAVGVYKNKKIEPRYKYIREHSLNVPVKLDVNYLGFHITVVIDTGKKETMISVNDMVHRLRYFFAVGNVVVIDGSTGGLKFFQMKGYSARREDLGNLMRGAPYREKTTEDIDVDVTGQDFSDLFSGLPLAENMHAVLNGKREQIKNQLFEINRRPFDCSIVKWNAEEAPEKSGVFLLLRDASHLERMLSDRNDIIQQIEEHNMAGETAGCDYPEDAFSGFAGKSVKAREVKYLAWKAANSRFNVILTGESGTGKSKLAREIHNIGMPQAPFVEVNCNAIAPTLFESELFGYVGGAFTGAKSEGKIGFFEAADKGTIFLDEIGEIPLDIQVKLLHVLQNKTIYRVGSSKPIKVDVRVIAATNRNLEEEVAQGRFRQDLFYRINVFPIEIPPLRERKADLYLLINQLLGQVCEMYDLEQKQFSGEALQKLVSYNWPGNVRELENAIERAITLCESNIIYSEHLRIGKGNIPVTMKEMLAKEEARILEMTLLKYNGDKQAAMEELDMSRTVFYDKLKKYYIKY